MGTNVFVILLAASAFQAGWNAIIKSVKLESPIAKAALLNFFGAIVGILLILSFGLPSKAAYVYLFTSAAVTYLYLQTLMLSYQVGEMAQVFPITRGAALILTAIVGALLAESLNFLGWLGIFVVAAGVLLLSMQDVKNISRLNPRAVGLALTTAAFLGAGLLIDGFGARISGSPFAYVGTKSVLVGILTLIVALVRLGPKVIGEMSREWKGGLLSGSLAVPVYAIGVWAMTLAPIPEVAAIRDTSVLFGAAIAAIFLKEAVRPIQFVSATAIVLLGIILIRLQ
jgi:drug/metabolite transporter (DMT)-like permease